MTIEVTLLHYRPQHITNEVTLLHYEPKHMTIEVTPPLKPLAHDY